MTQVKKNQPIDKKRQKIVMQWLKTQRNHASALIRLNALIGFLMSCCLIIQAGLLAWLLHEIIIENRHPNQLMMQIIALFFVFIARAILLLMRENIGQRIGQTIRKCIRAQLFKEINHQGPSALQFRSSGTWSTILIEYVDNLHDYYAKYIPQMQIAVSAPLTILIAVFWFNWAAGLILLFTAPLVPIFMALVGMGAADANRRNFKALALLSGYFLDRLKGLDTLFIFDKKSNELENIAKTSHDFRIRTMEVLRIAFLSSAVLEFFTSISIAVMAVYFGFSFLGDLDFGHYGTPITLLIGFFCLILAPEFYQPLRDLGTYYHAKAAAVAAADTLIDCLDTNNSADEQNNKDLNNNQIDLNDEAVDKLIDWSIIEATNVRVKSHDGHYLTQPLNFTLTKGDKIALIGRSGSGKSTIIHFLLGFLPFEGEIKIDGIVFKKHIFTALRGDSHWLGQHPFLPANTIKDNLLLTADEVLDENALWSALKKARAYEFVTQLPHQLSTEIGENALRLSVGQAQRLALARLFISSRSIWFLDEPTASLDKENADLVLASIYTSIFSIDESHSTNTTMFFITHQLEEAKKMDKIWYVESGILMTDYQIK